MAKAVVKCKCKVCGNTFIKSSIKYNRKDADSWEEWAINYYDKCDDCVRAEREAHAKELAKAAEEDGLPALVGSQKQIVWAEQIRADFIRNSDTTLIQLLKKIKDYKEREQSEKRIQRAEKKVAIFEATRSYMLHKIKEARWWIDNRFDTIYAMEKVYINHAAEIESGDFEEKKEEKMEELKIQRADLIPENQTEGVAKVFITEKSISATYPRDDKFSEIVKGLKMIWDKNSCEWIRNINQFSGSSKDRAAELANNLLKAGFAVICADEDVRKMAIDETFEPETEKWIAVAVSGEFSGWLCIRVGKDHDLYVAARNIKGAQYSNGGIYVPVAQHKAVLDFGKAYAYKVSEGAKNEIQKYIDNRTSSVSVKK